MMRFSLGFRKLDQTCTKSCYYLSITIPIQPPLALVFNVIYSVFTFCCWLALAALNLMCTNTLNVCNKQTNK